MGCLCLLGVALSSAKSVPRHEVAVPAPGERQKPARALEAGGRPREADCALGSVTGPCVENTSHTLEPAPPCGRAPARTDASTGRFCFSTPTMRFSEKPVRDRSHLRSPEAKFVCLAMSLRLESRPDCRSGLWCIPPLRDYLFAPAKYSEKAQRFLKDAREAVYVRGTRSFLRVWPIPPRCG